MNILKNTRVGAAVAFFFCIAAACADTTSVWTWREGVGNTITNAVDWFDAQNWDENGVANGEAAKAQFPKSFSGLHYVKANAAVNLKQFTCAADSSNVGYGANNRQIIVSDEPFTFYQKGNASAMERADFYTDVRWYEGSTYSSYFQLAGDFSFVKAGATITINSHFIQRLDLYTKVPGGVRTNFFLAASMQNSWGPFMFYAPHGTSEKITGTWASNKNSPYLFRKGAAHTIPVGTYVHGSTIPEGAWVKRVFTDDVIEISENATDTADEMEVTFDSLTVSVYASIGSAQRSGNGEHALVCLNKYRAEDEFRFEIGSLSFNGPFFFDTTAGFVPGTLILHKTIKNDSKYACFLRNCHLQFQETGTDDPPGFSKTALMDNAAHTARITVTNGLEAVLSVTNLVGTLVKDGEGTLQLDVSMYTNKNTGTIVVEKGTVVFTNFTTAAEHYIQNLVVSNGACAKAAADVRVGNLAVDSAGTIAGPGFIKTMAIMPLAAAQCAEGGAVVYCGAAATVRYEDAPATNVVGEPALWMDVSKEGSVTFDPDTLEVSRLDDVRGAGYFYAYPDLQKPTVVTNEAGKAQHIYFKRFDNNKQGCQRLLWTNEVANICALSNVRVIFKVMCAAEGGGSLLGSSARKSRRDFWRDEWVTVANKPVFYTGAGDVDNTLRPPHITNGVFYANGELRDWHLGYPYRGGNTAKSTKAPHQFTPLLAEYHVPAPGGYADNFSYISGGSSRCGRERLYEVIVYTNALTQAERMQVAGYLMKKWHLGEVDYSVSEGETTITTLDTTDGTTLGVDADTALRVTQLSGNGGFTKQGGGMVYLDELANASAPLTVAGGVLNVRSFGSTVADLPAGAYLHLDALNEASIDVNSSGTVTTWRDTRGGSYPTATRSSNPVNSTCKIVDNVVNGHRVVSLGNSEGSIYGSLIYPACEDLRTVFLVSGTATYGGTLIGSTYTGPTPLTADISYSQGTLATLGGKLYGLYRRAGGCYGTNITYDTFVTASQFGYSSSDPGIWTMAWTGPGATYFRHNGVDTNIMTAGFTHAGDLVCLAMREDVYGDALSVTCDWVTKGVPTYYWGGQQVGEYILYRETLSPESMRRVEAYLKKKWFGEEVVGYRTAAVSDLTIAEGATLTITGGGGISAKSFAGGGTVNGDVSIASGAAEVLSFAGGTLPTFTVNGTLDLSGGGTFTLVGAAATMPVGKYALARATTLKAGTWKVSGPSGRSFKLAFEDNTLYLTVAERGLAIFVR